MVAYAAGDSRVSGPDQGSCSSPPPHHDEPAQGEGRSVMSLGCPGPGTDGQALGAPPAQGQHVGESLRY